MKKILIDHGKIKEMAKGMNVSRQTVYNAIKGITSSETALRIRKKALELGGVEVPTKK